MEPFEAAGQWFDWLGEGRLLWTEPGEKAPSKKLGKWSTKVPYTIDDIPKIFGKAPADCGYWLALPDWLIMVGPDNQEAIDLLSQRLSGYKHTYLEKSPKGEHAIFSGGPVKNDTSLREGDAEWDVRSSGGGVKCWPSEGYVKVRDFTHLRRLPPHERVPGGLYPAGCSSDQEEGTDGSPEGKAGLDALLAAPPTEGQRNDWLIRVCGHLAKIHPFRDSYERICKEYAAKLISPPLTDEEVQGRVDSAWSMERQKVDVSDFKEESGYLVGNGTAIYTQIKRNDDWVVVRFANFDVTARGVIMDEFGRRTYDLVLHKGEIAIPVMVPATKFGSWPSLAPVLAAYSGVWDAPGNDGRKSPAARLQNYIDAQNPPEHTTTDALGWIDGEGFITHEGVITAEGWRPHDKVVPAPQLRSWAPHKYGFGDEKEAIEALKTLMTFHFEEVTAVFASYCMACVLKEHLHSKVALWPFLALEAPSGSGKTTGFFPLMLSLMGWDDRPGVYTSASLRDALTANRNCPVWIDDPSSVKDAWNNMRQATGGGSSTKKGEDNYGQIKAVMVAPVILSGEGFPELHREKALADRALMVEVPDPQKRLSVFDPDNYQWLDITEFRAEHKDTLNTYAGNVVQIVLSMTEVIDNFDSYRTIPGRIGDKIAVIRLGADILSRITDDPRWREIVYAWAVSMEVTENEDFLIQRILPYFIQSYGMMSKPNLMNPVYVDKAGIVWFNVHQVAHMWEQTHRDPRDLQLGSLDALKRQMERSGIKGSTPKPIYGPGGVEKRLRYQRCTQEQSRGIVAAAGYVAVDEYEEILEEEEISFGV